MVSAGSSIRTVTGNDNRPAALLAPRMQRAWVGVFSILVLVGFARMNSHSVAGVIGAVVAIGAGAALLRVPRSLQVVVAAVAGAGVTVVCNGMSSNVGWFALCLLCGWCVLIAGRRDGLVFWAGAVAVFVSQWVWVESDPGWASWIAGANLTVIGGWFAAHEIDLVAQLRAAQAGLADKARAEERNRIARELHDVIAHTLTVSLLHVTSARLAVEHDPADAARALAEAERLGRESLAEVRAAVGLLHQDDDGTATAPLPGVEGLPDLVERFRSARADVTLTVDGDTGGMPATTSLAVYRIVQEALTNAVRHAPGTAVAIGLAYEPEAVEVTVDSAGKPRTGKGLGIDCMRERAESMGGWCEAGPGGRGWLVRARLPLERRQDST